MLIVLTFQGLQGLPQEPSAEAAALLQLLKEKDCEFLEFPGSSKTIAHPESRITATGQIVPQLAIRHPILGATGSKDTHARTAGLADLGFMPGPLGFVQMYQTVRFGHGQSLDTLADRLRDFARLIQPSLNSDYCSIDEFGAGLWMNVPALDISHLCWFNAFGSRYINKYGRSYFISAPGWHLEEPGSEGVSFSPEKSFTRWLDTPAGPDTQRAVQYFQGRFPNITQYRAKPVDLPSAISRMVLTDDFGEEEVVYDRDKRTVGKKKHGRRGK